MKLIVALAALVISGVVAAQTYVPGYTKSDGTYVQGHFKSAPNNTKLDNYSTKGNSNPYTGKAGTVEPYPTYKPVAPKQGVIDTKPPNNCVRSLLDGRCL